METLGRGARGWNRQKAERALGARCRRRAGDAEADARTFDDLADEFDRGRARGEARKKSTVDRLQGDDPQPPPPGVRHRRPRAAVAVTGAVRAVRGRQAGRQAVTEDGTKPPRVARADVQDRAPLAVGDARTRSTSSSHRRCRTRKRRRSTAAEVRGNRRRTASWRPTRRTRSGVVRGRSPDDRHRSLDRPPTRRTTRAAMDGRRTPRPAPPRPSGVRQERDHDAEEPRRGGGRSPLGHVARRRARGAVRRRAGYRAPESIVFCHPALGTPLDPSKLARYTRKAIDDAGVDKSFRPWHGLRHTALTETAAAGVPAMFVQAKAGHAQGSTTERYLHAAKTSYPTPPRSRRSACSPVSNLGLVDRDRRLHRHWGRRRLCRFDRKENQ